jgi:betaine-homocysteine S-methyltransferase
VLGVVETLSGEAAMPGLGLRDRLATGPVICAEGYLFALEARGYLQAGAFVPEVVLEHPEVVAQLHREFARCGSDVIQAFTYYAHREKLRLIGREHDLEPMNRQALRLARAVAAEHGALMAGNVCNTNVYDPADPATHAEVRGMFTEQIGWAVDEGAEMLICETFGFTGEALIALDVAEATGLASVVTMAQHTSERTRDGDPIETACRKLADAGADVVGLNCARGPWTMLPLLERIRAEVPGHLAALPVPYRTTPEEPAFQVLSDPGCPCPAPHGRPFPTALDPLTCTRYEMAEFARRADALGVGYLGICCGAEPHHVRAMAEALGRTTEAGRYAPDMSKHYALGDDTALKETNRRFAASYSA